MLRSGPSPQWGLAAFNPPLFTDTAPVKPDWLEQ